METSKPLLKDAEAEDVDVHLYRSMISSLMYLTSSRPDIMFAVCACARFQVTPKVSHLHAMKRIFRYLKGQPKLGLWYPKDSPFDFESYTDSDYAGACLDRKSTTGGCQFLGSRLNSWQCKKQTVVANSTTEAEYVVASNCCGQVLWIQNQLLDYGYNFMNTKIFIDNESTIYIVKNPVFHSKTKHIEIRHHFIRDSYETRLIQVIKIHIDHNVADLLIKAFDVSRFQYLIATANDGIKVSAVGLTYYKNVEREEERRDSIERAATTAASLDAEQDSGTIIRTQSMATLNELIPQGTGLVNTPGSGEERLKIMELMEICTKLSDRVLALENSGTTQLEDYSLKKREDASKQGRNIAESDQDEEISFVQEDAETQGRYDQDIDVTTVSAPISTAGMSVSTAVPSTPPTTTTTVIEDEDLTISQTLMKMRSEKSKEKAKERGSKEKSSEPATRPTRGVTMQEPSESGTRKAVPPSQHDLKDKGKAKMIEPEKPLKKKDQIKFDEEVAKRLAEELEAELEEEERVTIQREEEANLISWDNTQAMMEADYELAQRLQAEEQGELTIEERSRLFVELMDKRKKHFAKLRAEKIRRKPPTKAQKKN
ncbi:hypothetical protein Tco_0786514 [Tanacetum coccineum]